VSQIIPMLLAVLGLGSLEDGPDGLIGRLGSARYQERELAQQELRALGARALPLLNAARNHPDVEVQSRALAILQDVESQLMLEPLRLPDWNGPLPLGELTGRLSRLAGRPIRVGRVVDRLNALVSPPPGNAAPTFWEAINRLESICRVRALSVIDAEDDEASSSSALTLVPVRPGSPVFSQDRGPFRIKLLSANVQKTRNFELAVADVDEPESRRNFHVQMQVVAEPRLVLIASSSSRVVEASDDRGQSLLKSDPTADEMEDDDFLFLDGGAGSCLTTSLDLDLPERPGSSIRTLRGVVPLTVLQRRSTPQEIPLDGPIGRTYENSALRLTLKSIEQGADDGQFTLELILAANERHDSALLGLLGGPGLTLAQLLEHQCEVVDSQGKPQAIVPVEVDGDGPSLRVRLALLPSDVSRKPTRLLFYDLVVASQEVPFTFHNVPLP
jgi:hypothetical protein